MAKPQEIELPDGTRIPVLYEDRAVFAIDKPAGWMLAPESWDRTGRNLHLALLSAVEGGDFWARSRNLKYLRFAHRLDADTSGVLLLLKNPGAVQAYSRLFESWRVEKIYLAVVRGVPGQKHWTCRLKLAPDPRQRGRMKVDTRHGKEAETKFRIVQSKGETALVEARPLTGRTHQIRVHLAESGHPISGDALYGLLSHDSQPAARHRSPFPLALRAVTLIYPDPFQKRIVRIDAPTEEFCGEFGFS
ncbi:MAG TPA: RluA family pseudouridine synthase [Haliangiales bacterium]|nr:RluA family pseudouridine synthase [Haliangiales bacterium]